MSILDLAGKLITERVRDDTIDKSNDVIDGVLKSQQAQLIYEKLKHLSTNDKEAVKELIRLTVDSAIHNTLWLVEESPDVDLTVFFNDTEVHLSEESDGLSGELYSEDGWIERFSKHPPTY